MLEAAPSSTPQVHAAEDDSLLPRKPHTFLATPYEHMDMKITSATEWEQANNDKMWEILHPIILRKEENKLQIDKTFDLFNEQAFHLVKAISIGFSTVRCTEKFERDKAIAERDLYWCQRKLEESKRRVAEYAQQASSAVQGELKLADRLDSTLRDLDALRREKEETRMALLRTTTEKETVVANNEKIQGVCSSQEAELNKRAANVSHLNRELLLTKKQLREADESVEQAVFIG